VLHTTTSAEKTAPPMTGNAQLGMCRERTIKTFAVSAPKKKHPATPCTKIRTPLSTWNPSDHKQW
jgi:hypothetical protein